MPIYHRRWSDIFLRPTFHTLLLAAALLVCQPARGEVPRHEQHELTTEAPDQPSDHAGHANGPAAEQTGQQGTTDDGIAAEHVHPAPTEVPPEEAAGLEEKLGQQLPLDLTFRDEQGQPIKLSSLVTRPTVIAPIYYRCPNVCHFLQGDLARVLPQLKLEPGEDYQVVSISFDETETPELARRSRATYLSAMDNSLPAEAWRFLTGSRDEIEAFTQAIGFNFHRVGADFAHPIVLVVVAADGQIVRYLHGTHILPKDLTLALYEAKSGRVGTTIRKVVQYCFSFDPEQKTYVFNLLRISATVILLTLGTFLAFLILAGKKKSKDPSHD